VLSILLESVFSLTISGVVFSESIAVFSLTVFSVFEMIDSVLFSVLVVC
jgi:hypothetical protein